MSITKTEIKEGIGLHTIYTENFKTNLIAVFLTTPLTRQTITKNTLISMLLRRGSKSMPSQEAISIALEEMYGADFDCGIDKTGDNQVMKFYLESINNEYLPEKEDLLKQSLTCLFDIVFNPQIEKEEFNLEFFNGEKENLKKLIEGRKDNKQSYALSRCVEEMYKDKPYGLYKYGYVEDLEEITAKDLYHYYQELIANCKIDIFVSGKVNDQKVVEGNENIKRLEARKPNHIVNNDQQAETKKQEPNYVEDKLDVSQGKLIIGMNVEKTDEEAKNIAVLYNMILGGSANSKMFQNVREKANLAYMAGSSYIRQKNAVFIQCGIEIDRFDQALAIVKEQVEEMEKGNFSEEDIRNAKETILSAIKGIPDEQDTQITYYLGQELTNKKETLEEYAKKIEEVSKEQIVELAKNVKFNTIYFLRN